MVLPNTALFISLYKFFSKSFFARVLNCIVQYNREAMEIEWIVPGGSLLREDCDVAADCSGWVTLLIVQRR